MPTKSTLQRYEQMVPEALIRKIVRVLNIKASETIEGKDQVLGIEKSICFEECYTDTTVVKTNIHFPVDYQLLLDAVRTLVKATTWIRKHGIKNRMQSPESFLKTIKRSSMDIRYLRRKKGSKKEQKWLLRQMKKIVKRVRVHAEKHKTLLLENWETEGLKRGHVKQVLKRIDTILTQLPKAIAQVHSRIISEKLVNNKDKVLSFYEPETKVIIRGKYGAEVEFGNKLSITEQSQGVISDWKLYEDTLSDHMILIQSLDRLEKGKSQLKPKTVTGDRGFSSKKVETDLLNRKIDSFICPKNRLDLILKLKDDLFVTHQTRRSQTEGRIGILKNCFLGSPFRSKGFSSREKGVAWQVLVHNLWVIARLPRKLKDIPLDLAA